MSRHDCLSELLLLSGSMLGTPHDESAGKIKSMGTANKQSPSGACRVIMLAATAIPHTIGQAPGREGRAGHRSRSQQPGAGRACAEGYGPR